MHARRRPVRLRHDDAGRPGHLGGGPGGGRLRAARRPTWSSAGEPLAYALCRPPGHHATPAGFGGSCYLNNAAVAAAGAARGRRSSGSAIVDVDAHHGNGTAAIFYDRADVLYGSVHVDPARRLVPARRRATPTRPAPATGAGATRNLPLPEGTGDEAWLDAVRELADWVADDGCDGARRLARRRRRGGRPGEPAAGHARTATARPAPLLGATGLPAVVVQEGGYHLPTLGGLVAAYLDGHGSRIAAS